MTKINAFQESREYIVECRSCRMYIIVATSQTQSNINLHQFNLIDESNQLQALTEKIDKLHI